MKLTDGERLIVIMLAEVMEKLEVDGEIDPSLVKSFAYGGSEWAIARKYPGIFEGEAPADELVKETTDILWMFSIIESSIAKLAGDDASEAAGWLYNAWHGFDGNNDRHYGIAKTMIEDLGEFEDSRKGVALNSHTQSSLPRYRRMWEKFERYVHAGKAAPLNMEALRDLCA